MNAMNRESRKAGGGAGDVYVVKGGVITRNGREVTLGEIFGVKPEDNGRVNCALHIIDGKPLRFRDGECVIEDGRYFAEKRASAGKRRKKRLWLYHESIADRIRQEGGE